MNELLLRDVLTLGMGFGEDPTPPYVAALAMTVLAAIFVWLTVRVINRRERWAKWTLATVVAMPTLYFASFGPACWLVSRNEDSDTELPKIYTPIGWLCWNSPIVRRVMEGYGRMGMSAEQQVEYPIDEDMWLSITP